MARDLYKYMVSRQAWHRRHQLGRIDFVTAVFENQPKAEDRARVHALDHGEYVWEDVRALHRRAGADEMHRRQEEAKSPEQRDHEFQELLRSMGVDDA